MYYIERSFNISITRITRVNNIMLLLAMVSLHMLTFRLMVTMVAEFCSLVILIHNTLKGSVVHEIQGLMKKYTSIPQYVLIHFHMQRFKFHWFYGY